MRTPRHLKSAVAALVLLFPAGASADLLDAAHADDLEAARALVAAGADVKAANAYGVTPLILACENGNAELVELLLKAGADPNTSVAGGATAVMIAARTGRVACVKLLLDAGADIDAKDRRSQTAMMWAAAEGHAEVVELLLERGADFKTTADSGFTPLLFAAREGRSGVVRTLLKAGADPNEVTTEGGAKRPRSGTGPMMLAIENGHLELALELVDAGADPNDERSGIAPLHALTGVRKTERGENEQGAPPPDGSGKLGSLDFVREIVRRGARVNLRLKNGSSGQGRVNWKGATPFLLAAKAGDLPLLRLLVELGVDPTIPNVEKCHPFAAAAGVGVDAPGEEQASEADALETMVYLLELGADINAVDNNGDTAMHGAAYKCMGKLVHFLDKNGADIEIWNRKNKQGWTPLVIAQGFRFGNFRPIQETIDALSEVMKAKGVEPPPPPERRIHP